MRKKTKRTRMKRSILAWPRAGKYNVVNRALPYPSRGEKGCRWRKTVTPGGRKILEPIP